MKRLHALIIGAAGLALAVLAVVGFVLLQPTFTGNLAGVSGPVVSSGKALVGGPFSLTDHTGKRVTEKDFLGKFMLVYFGFTYCPDICPGELQVVAAAIDELGDKADQVRPVFITVDPERDTVAQLADYVPSFHQNMVGLTGTAEEIAAAAKAYRVYYAKVDDPDSTEYLMDHSSIIYLMDRTGAYVGHFPFGTKPKDIAAKVAQHLG